MERALTLTTGITTFAASRHEGCRSLVGSTPCAMSNGEQDGPAQPFSAGAQRHRAGSSDALTRRAQADFALTAWRHWRNCRCSRVCAEQDVTIDLFPCSRPTTPRALRPIAGRSVLVRGCPHCRTGHLISGATTPPTKKVSTLMLLLPFHPRLLHHSLQPDLAGTPPTAHYRRKSPQHPFLWRLFPVCIRTKRLPCPPQHQDCLVLPTPN